MVNWPAAWGPSRNDGILDPPLAPRGHDHLDGGAGNDILSGGNVGDFLAGGSDYDAFGLFSRIERLSVEDLKATNEQHSHTISRLHLMASESSRLRQL